MQKFRFFFLINIRHCEKIFPPFLGESWRGSQNCFLKVHTNFFEENIICWNNRFPDFFQTWVETFLIFVEFIRRGFQNCFLKGHTNFLRKMVFLELISVIINVRLEWKLAIRIFVEFFRRDYQNCFLQVHTFSLEKKNFLKKKFWKPTNSGNLLFGFLLKFSGGVVKIAFYKSIRTFQLKIFYLKKSSPWCCSDLIGFIFGKLLEYFQENCWNCSLRVNSKNLLRKFMIFSTSLSHIGKTIRQFLEIFETRLSKT